MIKNYALCLILICAFATTASADEFYHQFDGKWWSRQSHDEKYEFINAEEDCYQADADGKLYLVETTDDVIKLVDKYYASNHHNTNELLLPVFRTLASRNRKAPPFDPGGEVYTEPHGYFDGGYWEELEEQKLRLAYVEGYLACRSFYMKDTIKKPAEYYESEMSKWLYVDYKGNYRKIKSLIHQRSYIAIGIKLVSLLKKSSYKF